MSNSPAYFCDFTASHLAAAAPSSKAAWEIICLAHGGVTEMSSSTSHPDCASDAMISGLSSVFLSAYVILAATYFCDSPKMQ